MLTIRNHYDDRDITIRSRERSNGRDGEPVEVTIGKGASIEIDGDHDIIISTRPREPGEAAITTPPIATVLEEDGASEDRVELTDASDDEIKAAIEKTIAGGHVSARGVPHMDAINAELKAAGRKDIKAAKRDELFQPA